MQLRAQELESHDDAESEPASAAARPCAPSKRAMRKLTKPGAKSHMDQRDENVLTNATVLV